MLRLASACLTAHETGRRCGFSWHSILPRWLGLMCKARFAQPITPIWSTTKTLAGIGGPAALFSRFGAKKRSLIFWD